ncbi:MAG: hypothetical protein B7Y90_09025 [Alphaproteobacteria bacterium 32-64-14]|nr:MAG: hypothetical protein B7Y90_09025 [Alphaproteobacteria bacterium 32-64-14]
MHVCQNCKKIVDRQSLHMDGTPEDPMCPWCMQDSRYSPVARVVRSVWFGLGLLALVVAAAIVFLKPTG